jgi:hypothetical protein
MLSPQCPTCSQIFSSNLLLLTHLEVHSVIPSADHHRDSNPAMCRYCLKTFTSSLTLNEHIDEVGELESFIQKLYKLLFVIIINYFIPFISIDFPS